MVSSLSTFFLAMLLYPEVQRRAQLELDKICHGRLPEFSDRESLPYINALCREVLRWNPTAPLGVCVLNQILYHDARANCLFRLTSHGD